MGLPKAMLAPPAEVGWLTLKTIFGDKYIFDKTRIGSLIDINQSKDSKDLHILYYLVQGLKC